MCVCVSHFQRAGYSWTLFRNVNLHCKSNESSAFVMVLLFTEYPLLLLMFFQSVASVDTSCLLGAHIWVTFPNLILTILAGKKVTLKNTSKNYIALKILEFKALNWNQITLQTFHQKELQQTLRPKHFGIKMYIRPRKKSNKITTRWCPRFFKDVYLDKMFQFDI